MTGYDILIKVSFLFYLASLFSYILFFFTQRNKLGRTGFALACLGLALHVAAIALRGFQAQFLPVSNLYESLSFFSALIMIVYLVIEARQRSWIDGVFVLPLAVSLAGASFLLDRDIRPLTPALQSPWLGVHTTFCFLSYACFLLAFCFGIMYLWQEREVKSKKIDMFFFRLPALGTLDRIGYRVIGFGFVFLTLGIVSGSLWAYRAWGGFWSWDPKETWSLVTWLIYLVYLHGRLASGWQGKRSAWLAIAGFVAVLFTYFGVSFLLPGLHSYL